MIAETLPTVAIPLWTRTLSYLLEKLMRDPERLVITSIGDGVHAADSAHYRGEAIDLRSHDLLTMEDKRARQARLKETLGPLFSVQLEPYDVAGSTAAEHLHVQLVHFAEGKVQ
jgi:hypothetical protein